MDEKRNFELIITVVNRGFADDVMDAAKEVGASGGTVLYARGTGVHEAETFFGITIQPEKEVVLILTEYEKRKDIMKAIARGAGLLKEGKGMSFSLPVEDIAGIVHMMARMEKEESENE
ncbi:MAG: P-II family nitrogen regulator [Christensenellaceae bacterium]